MYVADYVTEALYVTRYKLLHTTGICQLDLRIFGIINKEVLSQLTEWGHLNFTGVQSMALVHQRFSIDYSK